MTDAANENGPTAYSGTSGPPRAKALVILPFASIEQAVDFANVIRGKDTGQTAIVTRGSCYEWVVDIADPEVNQVVEFDPAWDSYQHPELDNVTIIARGPNFRA